MSTILVNFAHLDPPNNGGVSRLAREVGRALVEDLSPKHRVVFVVRSRFMPKFRDWLGSNQYAWVIPYNHYIPTRWLLHLLRPNVVVSPLFGVEPFIDTGSIPHVVSIPDTLALDHPELFTTAELEFRRQVYEHARSAARIITLSAFSRTKLIQRLPVPEQRVKTIPLGADGLADTTGPHIVDEPYVFYPANTWHHKRHEFLLQIMALIWQAQPGLKLILSGGRPPGIDLDAIISHYAPRDAVIDLGFIPDEQVATFYRHSEALLFTSAYEGFGMPILEAMRAGCPVICSPVSAIPEVAGDAALYVTDDTPEAWASAFLDRLPRERQLLIEQGRRQAAQFTWTQTRHQWVRVILETVRVGRASD